MSGTRRSTTRIVSMTDVARLAGVSAQTVSRVSNSSDAVKPDTRDKVLAAMKELGYRPNFAARALKRGRFNAVGVIMFDLGSTGNLRALEGITNAASEHGYAVTIGMMNWADKPTLAETVRKMKDMPVDAIIVILEHKPLDFDTFTPPPTISVTLITTADSTTCSTIDSDQYGCSRTIVDYFLEHGHRNVHYVSGPEDSVANGERERGWRETLEAHGLTPPRVIRGDWQAESGYDAGLQLAATPGCTAVYAANDNMANGVMLGVKAAGRRVPEEVSVIGVDDSLGGVVPRLNLTTVRLHFSKVGRMAFEQTLEVIEGRRSEITHQLVPCTLIERDSVATLR